jgi:hypothetical protein
MHNSLVWPLVSMAVLTLLVWLRLYQTRIGEMQRKRIHPQRVAASAQMAQLLEDTRAADNFRNLFELPVLFYLALLLAMQLGVETSVLWVLAWVFVGLRYLHSYIHCTYNRVKDRFTAYLLGGLALWAIWGVLLYDWLA